MWINFDAPEKYPYAVRIYSGGVNRVSGRRMGALPGSQSLQPSKPLRYADYVVAPRQRWIDGIATGAGTVRQFVAATQASGLSIEAQVTGKETVAGLQIEVSPLRADLIFVRTLKNKIWTFFYTSAVRSGTVHDLKLAVQAREGTPPDQQRFLFAGKQMEDEKTLDSLGITEGRKHFSAKWRLYAVANCNLGDTIHQVLRLRGGGGTPEQWKRMREMEMNLAAGGLIKQYIVSDPFGSKYWDTARTKVFNVQILNASVHESVTGLKPSPCPMDEKNYKADMGVFYDMPGEASTIHGDFEGVESVESMEIRKQVQAWMRLNPKVKLNPDGPLH